jgi:hypothetical protein
MRARMGAFVAFAFVSVTATAHAANRMTGAEIQAAFFNGQPFTASTPSGVKFKMMFTADGKVTREPVSSAGAKGEGTWKLDKDGYCTTWKGQKPNCFGVLPNGQNKWSVMKASTLIAVWTK